jgi:hypothetical protein
MQKSRQVVVSAPLPELVLAGMSIPGEERGSQVHSRAQGRSTRWKSKLAKALETTEIREARIMARCI